MGEHLCEKIHLAEKCIIAQKIYINSLIRNIKWQSLSDDETHHLYSLGKQTGDSWIEYEKKKGESL